MSVTGTSWCVQCGPMVRVDEDGLCASCGATCMGEYADAANEMRWLLKKIARRKQFTASRQAARALLVKMAGAESWSEIAP